MNSHFYAEMTQSRLAEIEQAAERYRREGISTPRTRRFARSEGSSRRPLLRLRAAATRQA
jgi:hypothetical protein